MKKLEAVIFDMDGVLFDTERMSCECCFEAAKQLGLTLAEEAVYGGCGRNEASLRRHIMETEEPWYPNGTFPYEEYRERFMALFQESLERELPVKKGVRELLEYLKHTPPGTIADIRKIYKNGITDSVMENMDASASFAATSSAIINGAFLYSLAAAIAPLH